jgi:hypothetical protein
MQHGRKVQVRAPNLDPAAAANATVEPMPRFACKPANAASAPILQFVCNGDRAGRASANSSALDSPSAESPPNSSERARLRAFRANPRPLRRPAYPSQVQVSPGLLTPSAPRQRADGEGGRGMRPRCGGSPRSASSMPCNTSPSGNCQRRAGEHGSPAPQTGTAKWVRLEISDMSREAASRAASRQLSFYPIGAPGATDKKGNEWANADSARGLIPVTPAACPPFSKGEGSLPAPLRLRRGAAPR